MPEIIRMRVFCGFDNLPQFTNAVATMGSFDGVHGGHRVLLNRVKQRAQSIGGESIVLTFHPHPRYVLGTAEDMKLLSTLDEKIWLLDKIGIDNLIVIPFTVEFSHTSPEQFIAENIAAIGIKWLIVGYNHRFGYQKQGNYNLLESCRGSINIEMVEQQHISESKVSSTIIRQQIESGAIGEASKLLSHPYVIMCEVGEDSELAVLDEHKLLPPAGEYDAMVGGRSAILSIDEKCKLKLTMNEEGLEFAVNDKVIIEIK